MTDLERIRTIPVLLEQPFLEPGDRLVCFGDSITHGYPYPGMGTLEGPNFPALLSKLLNTES